MRYFYRLGSYPSDYSEYEKDKLDFIRKEERKVIDESLKRDQNKTILALSLLSKLESTINGRQKEIPKIFNDLGYDKRTWKTSNKFCEIDAECYKGLSDLESKIKKDAGFIQSNLKGWHFPICIEGDAEEGLKKAFNLKEVAIKDT